MSATLKCCWLLCSGNRFIDEISAYEDDGSKINRN